MATQIVKDPIFLEQVSSPAEPADIRIGKELQEMLAANRETCLGLAANMIGYHKRVIIISLGFMDLVMYNPRLVSKKAPYETQEGCLSLTGMRPTRRYREISVTYQDASWQEKTITLTDLPAQICQHELDHLEGILI